MKIVIVKSRGGWDMIGDFTRGVAGVGLGRAAGSPSDRIGRKAGSAKADSRYLPRE